MSEQPLTDGDKLRTLATWFDHFDDWREATGKIAPGITDYREVQEDLRRIAATLDAARAGVSGDAAARLDANPRKRWHQEETDRGRKAWACVPLVDAVEAGVPGDEGLRASMQRELDSGWAVSEVLRRHGIRANLPASSDD